jgi:hypothetical protein
MDLQGGMGQMEAHFDPFGDSVNLHARLVHGLRRTCNRLRNRFGRTGWNSKVTWVNWKLASVVWIHFLSQRKIGARLHRMYYGHENLFGRTRGTS